MGAVMSGRVASEEAANCESNIKEEKVKLNNRLIKTKRYSLQADIPMGFARSVLKEKQLGLSL